MLPPLRILRKDCEDESKEGRERRGGCILREGKGRGIRDCVLEEEKEETRECVFITVEHLESTIQSVITSLSSRSLMIHSCSNCFSNLSLLRLRIGLVIFSITVSLDICSGFSLID